jgi:predicted kinase
MSKIKYIVVLVGIPCSGKSRYARDYFGFDHTNCILSRDVIRENMWGKDYKPTREREKIVTNKYNRLLESALNDADLEYVILDNTHCREKYINEIVEKYYEDHIIMIKFFDISLINALFRNILRYCFTGKWIPINIIRNMYKNYNNIDRRKYAAYLVQS